jgi:hypothetical protein
MRDKDLKMLWEDVRDWLSDATRTAIKEAEDLTRRGRLKMDIMNLSRQIEKRLAELGGVVYDRVSATPDAPVVADAAIRQLVQKIAKLESERQAKQKEYEAEKKKN